MWHGAALLLHELVAAFRGDYVAARKRLLTTLESPEVRDVRVFHTMALYGLAVAALGAEHVEDAYTHVRRIIDTDSTSSHYIAHQTLFRLGMSSFANRDNRTHPTGTADRPDGGAWAFEPSDR
jgi:hypothetical protein